MKLADLVVGIGANTKELDKGLGKAMREMRNFGKHTKQLGKSMSMSITAPILALGAAAVKSAADLETMETSFISLTGGTKQAADMMRNLNQFTAKTPFQIEAVAKSARQLIASGSGLNEVNEQLQFLGDIAATSGQPIDEIAAIFAKVNAKGKVELENLNQLAERGIPIFTALSEATGLPADKLGAGAVSVDQFNEVLKSFAAEGGFAAGAMQRLSETAAGKFSTALDNLKLAGASLAQSLMPVLKDMLDRFVGILQAITQLSPETKKYIVIIAGVAAALGPLLVILPQLGAAFTMMTGPIGLTIGAIALLGVGIYTFSDEVGQALAPVINWFISLYNESVAVRAVIGSIKAVVKTVFNFFGLAITNIIESFRDIGTIISAAMAGDFSSIPGIIADSFERGGERAAEFARQAGEDWRSSIEEELTREPIELVTPESISEGIKSLGGLKDAFDSMFSGGGGGGGATGSGQRMSRMAKKTAESIVPSGLIGGGGPIAAMADAMDTNLTRMEDRIMAFKTVMWDMYDALAMGAEQFGNQMGQAFGAMARGAEDGKDRMKEATRGIINQALAAAQATIIEAMISSGKFSGPAAPIVIPALVAGGIGLVQSLFADIPAFADGGIISGPTVGLMGEYPGAKTNPEVIAPLDKLQGMLGAAPVVVTGKIAGNDIRLSNQRSERNAQRFLR